jgi:hypothetical protein
MLHSDHNWGTLLISLLVPWQKNGQPEYCEMWNNFHWPKSRKSSPNTTRLIWWWSSYPSQPPVQPGISSPLTFTTHNFCQSLTLSKNIIGDAQINLHWNFSHSTTFMRLREFNHLKLASFPLILIRYISTFLKTWFPSQSLHLIWRSFVS